MAQLKCYWAFKTVDLVLIQSLGATASHIAPAEDVLEGLVTTGTNNDLRVFYGA